MLLRTSLPIAGDDTTASLHDKLAALGARDDRRCAAPDRAARTRARASTRGGDLLRGENQQERSGVRLPARCRIGSPAACAPSIPPAAARLDGQTIKCWQEGLKRAPGRPGQVLASDEHGVVVACGSGLLRLTQLQKPGGKRLPVGDFLRGFPLAPAPVSNCQSLIQTVSRRAAEKGKPKSRVRSTDSTSRDDRVWNSAHDFRFGSLTLNPCVSAALREMKVLHSVLCGAVPACFLDFLNFRTHLMA